jgi:hypothetical protein
MRADILARTRSREIRSPRASRTTRIPLLAKWSDTNAVRFHFGRGQPPVVALAATYFNGQHRRCCDPPEIRQDAESPATPIGLTPTPTGLIRPGAACL